MEKKRPEPGNSLERMVALLDLFEESPSGWTFERIHSRLGYTRSTLYRYLKILSDAELLSSLPEAGFRFSAVPARVAGMGSWPVRAYAAVPG